MNDLPIKYGGRQTIYLKDENIKIPMTYMGALIYLPIRKPTRKEINEAEIFDLTDVPIWIPRLELDRNLSWWDPDPTRFFNDPDRVYNYHVKVLPISQSTKKKDIDEYESACRQETQTCTPTMVSKTQVSHIWKDRLTGLAQNWPDRRIKHKHSLDYNVKAQWNSSHCLKCPLLIWKCKFYNLKGLVNKSWTSLYPKAEENIPVQTKVWMILEKFGIYITGVSTRKYWTEKPKFDKFIGHLFMNFQFETGNNSIMSSEVNEVWINGGTTMSTLGNEFYVFEGPTRVQVRGKGVLLAEMGFGIVKVCGFEGWRVMLRINGERYSPNVTSVLSAIQIKAAYHVVHNTPRIYRGKQCIQLDQSLHFLDIPLIYRKGFFYMKVIKPTFEDITRMGFIDFTPRINHWTIEGELGYNEDEGESTDGGEEE